MAADIFGMAIGDYYQQALHEARIHTYSSLDEEDDLPVSHLFREFEAMPALEKEALELCRGSVLDIGCGAGSHSLYLANKGLKVTALDISPGAVEVSRSRGLDDVIQSDFWTFGERTYDTLLLLMNGIGIVGQLQRLPAFLSKARQLINPAGQILFDSSDIRYMFYDEEDGSYIFPEETAYYGEVIFEMEYKGIKSAPFPWLYVDFDTVDLVARECGFRCELVRKGEHYDYLARLTLMEY